MNLKELIDKIPPFFKNKYVIAIVIFCSWLLIFDKNNLTQRFTGRKEINQLKKDKQYYLEKIKQDSFQLIEIKTNNKAIEKVAREQYLMKKENEDVFIIVEENNTKKDRLTGCN